MLEQQDGGEICIVCKGFEIAAYHFAQFFIRWHGLAGDLPDIFCEHIEGSVEQGQQDLLLGGDMMIQTGLLQADGPGDLGHGSSMEPLLPENLCGCVENIVSGHELSFPTER